MCSIVSFADSKNKESISSPQDIFKAKKESRVFWVWFYSNRLIFSANLVDLLKSSIPIGSLAFSVQQISHHRGFFSLTNDFTIK